MSFATIITQSKQLSKTEQFSLAMELLKSFEPQIKVEKNVVPSIASVPIEMAKALPLLPASDAEPIKEKKPPSAWMNHMAHVRSFLPKEAQGKPCLQISSMLKTEGKMFADEADILAAYARWQENPPAKAEKAEKKPKADKAPSSASSVVSDEEPKKRRGPKKLVDMTAEERAAHDAKKAARKAEKAAKEAESTDDEEPKEEKKRGPKKLVDMTEEERAAHDAKKAAKKAAKSEWPPFPPMPVLAPLEEEIVVE